MKSDPGQSSGKQHCCFFRDISGEISLCVRGYLSYLAGIFGHNCIGERNIKKRKLERRTFFGLGGVLP